MIQTWHNTVGANHILGRYQHWITWFPPLLGFTNTSRGFMSWEGRGFTRKGFQRPSWSWVTKHQIWHVYKCGDKKIRALLLIKSFMSTQQIVILAAVPETNVWSNTADDASFKFVPCWKNLFLVVVSRPHLRSLLAWFVAFQRRPFFLFTGF